MGLLIVESYGLEIVFHQRSLFHTHQFCYVMQSAWLVIVYTYSVDLRCKPHTTTNSY